MTTIAFDTLKFAQALKEKAHLTTEQAEGFASAIADALHDDLATKADLREVELQLNAKSNPPNPTSSSGCSARSAFKR